MIASNAYDVAILGGGLAALTLAKQLLMKRPQTRIAIIEKNRFPVAEACHKVGESTVEIGAHYLGEDLQLKKHLTEQQLPKFGLRFFFHAPHQTISEGTEMGGSTFLPAPSYQLDRGRFENFLAEVVTEMGATLLSGSTVRDVELDTAKSHEDSTSHRISYLEGDDERQISARWVIDASGRASLLKRKLDLEQDLEHDINSVWFRLDYKIEIDSWCNDGNWQSLAGKIPRRWLSTNHLMGAGYWVWLIPLSSGSTSVGIVADPRIHPLQEMNSVEKAIAWLDEHEPECADHLRPHLDKLQDFLAIKKISRGAKQVFSSDRWGLVGEAAALLDPFYSPGSDFIAIGNTMVAKLIEEDLAGNSIQRLAPSLQSIFLTLFQNMLITYRDQYPLFGHPQIMSLKVVWDYSVYWGFPALLFCNGKMADVEFLQRIGPGVEEIRQLSTSMQQFFRDWYAADSIANAPPAFVNQNEIDVLTKLNAELREQLDDAGLEKRFFKNVALLRDLASEITERIKRLHPQVVTDHESPSATENRLDHVFELLDI